jgi:hypothetical protein
MVTQDRPVAAERPVSVAEVERAAGAPCVPALHGGTPYVKRPPEPKWPVWPSFSDGVERLKDPIDAKPSEYRGYAEDSQELPDMKFVSSARPEIWTMRASAGGFLPDDSPRPDFILNASPPNPKTLVARTRLSSATGRRTGAISRSST